MDVEKVKEIAREHMDLNDMMHGWDHIERVYKLAVRIGEEEGADLEVVKLAALLHDTGCHIDRDNHEEASAEIAEEVLEGYDKKDEVVHCILVHRFSKDRKPETLEAEILQDADRLEAVGAIGLVRAFVHAGFHGRPVYDGEKEISRDWDGEDFTTLDHIHKKHMKIPDVLHTEAARKIASHRYSFMEGFLEELHGEIRGET